MGDIKEKIIRFCLAVALCVFMAVMMGYLVQPIQRIFSHPEAASLLIYLETGRVVKPQKPQILQPAPEETIQPTQDMEQGTGISFEKTDAELIQVSNFSRYVLDVEALLMTDLTWDLTREQPQVLIVHSHATESYTQTQQFSYTPSAAYRTLDTHYNMVRVGQALQEALEAKGIGVIHDKTLYDHPSYNDAYIQSREGVQMWLEQYPSISLVIDLHRDAAGDSAVGQLKTQVTIDGKSSAQLMMVVGSNAGGRQHPNWKDNLALAVKLHAQLEKRFPGICRPISFRTERFNQDLSSGALLIEVGAAGDTLEDALAAAEFLAEGISDLAQGTVTAGSTS